MATVTYNPDRIVKAKALVDEAIGYDDRLMESERQTLVQVRKLLGAILSKSPLKVENVAADLLLAAGLSAKRSPQRRRTEVFDSRGKPKNWWAAKTREAVGR